MPLNQETDPIYNCEQKKKFIEKEQALENNTILL